MSLDTWQLSTTGYLADSGKLLSFFRAIVVASLIARDCPAGHLELTQLHSFDSQQRVG